MACIKELLTQARQQLQALPDIDPVLESTLLLAHALGKSRTWIYTWPERTATKSQVRHFRQLLAQRCQGTPIAHLTGRREFWSFELEVTPDTLIPRPDTELLVATILERHPSQPSLRVLDLGTGTGAIALALALERPDWQITATDRSAAALAVARRNGNRLNVSNLRWEEGDWFAALSELTPFDLIVSNPPYVAKGDPHLQQGDVRHEPLSALAAGPDGLDDLCLIITQSPKHLVPGGTLLVEHGYDQGQSVRELFHAAGFAQVETLKDLGGNDRVTLGSS